MPVIAVVVVVVEAVDVIVIAKNKKVSKDFKALKKKTPLGNSPSL